MYWNYRIADANDNTITYADSLVVAQSEALRLVPTLTTPGLSVIRCADETIVTQFGMASCDRIAYRLSITDTFAIL